MVPLFGSCGVETWLERASEFLAAGDVLALRLFCAFRLHEPERL